jgi:hypothetical protein
MSTARFILLLCVLILVEISGSVLPVLSCSDAETCMKVHLQNPALLVMMNQRCKFDDIAGDGRRITFSHLPKTGGSSVRDFLRAYARSRTRPQGHENFVVSALDEPKNIFATMLREPVSRAISFYSYANSIPALSKDAQANPLWAATYKADPVQWSSDPFIQRTLYQDPLGFFLRNVPNITHSITRFDYGEMQRMPEVPVKDVIPGTLNSFLAYTDPIPVQFQCTQHLEVAFILLRYYEVVGTLEKSADFYKVLFRRANLRDPHAKDIHSNKTKYTLSAEERATMTANLKAPLYCAEVLWRIASMISEKDVLCGQ